MDAFVLLGDSLFQRAFSQDKDETGQVIGSLGPRLSDAYARRLDVINRGFSGYNTRQILSILSERGNVLPTSTRFVVIFLGANDARLPNTPGGPPQYVPLGEFGDNMTNIIRKIRWWRQPRHLILVTPPPVDERQTVAADSAQDAGVHGVARRKAAITAAYARTVRDVGEKNGVPVLDLWRVMMRKAGYKTTKPSWTGAAVEDSESDYVDENGTALNDRAVGSSDEYTMPGSSAAPENEVLKSYLHDGLHLSRKGYDLLYEELMKLIAEKFLDGRPEHLPFVVPAWDAEGVWKQREAPVTNIMSPEERDKLLFIGAIAGVLVISVVFWLVGLFRR